MKLPFVKLCRATVAATLVGLTWIVSAADVWPERAVTLVIPFPPGGTTDIIGRVLARSLSNLWKQSVIVENRGGAGGTIGALRVVQAAPDGYTLLLGTPADEVNAPLLLAKPPYDPARELTPAGCVNRGFNVLVVNSKVPVHSVAELIVYAKAHPGQMHFASAGNGNTSHLSGELFAQSAGIDSVHVPYRGNAPAVTDTVSGQVQMVFSGLASVLSFVQSSTLRILAVTSNKRVASLPDTPTLEEAGLPVQVYSWACVFAPAKTPAALISHINATLIQALDDPEIDKIFAISDSEKFVQTPEQARQFLAHEREFWGNLIRSRHIQAN